MNRKDLKLHIKALSLIMPKGLKFALIGQSLAVLESAEDLQCEYLDIAMDRHGYAWAGLTYGVCSDRLEGEWVGNSWLKVHPVYNESNVIWMDGVPCQYVDETNPFQDDPMLDRPVPHISDYLADTDPAALITRRNLPAPVPLSMKLITSSPSAISSLLDEGVGEGYSAAKALLRDTAVDMAGAIRYPSFRLTEYRASLVKAYQDRMGFTDCEKDNRRRFNNASLMLKVRYTRYVKALAMSCQKELTKFPLTTMFTSIACVIKVNRHPALHYPVHQNRSLIVQKILPTDNEA